MTTPRHDRLIELLADRALVGLEPQEQIELAELMLEFPAEDAVGYDRAAAAIALAALEVEALPAALAARIEREASFQAATDVIAPPPRHHAATVAMPDAPARPAPAPPQRAIDPRVAHTQQMAPAQSAPPVQSMPPVQPTGAAPSNIVPFPVRPAAATPSRPSRAFAIGGWIAAAACLVLAIGAVVYRGRAIDPVSVVPSTSVPPAPVSVASITPEAPPSPRAETAAALRERLLALKATAKVEWSATKDPAAKGATGDVVWNAEEQKGTMRFRGLAKNDATRAQYQLWIFDKSRDDKYPVDGGVFDVDDETGDVIVAIDARLPVDKATLFAVTIEKPGGVVVSKRERIVVTAKLPAG